MVDLDELLSYETFKIVKVKDRRLGLLYRIFQIAIFVYLITEIILNQLYLKTEPPIPGAVRVTLQAPTNLSTPSYCSGGIGCTFWGANEIQYPNDGAGVAFFTTRATVTNYPLPSNCTSFLRVSDPTSPCYFNSKTANSTVTLNKTYIGGIEDYTMMIEHSIRGDQTSVAVRNGLLDGSLMSSDGKTVIKSFTNASRTTTNPSADGDIFAISEFLSAAKANLDAPSTAPGADKANGETYRSSGIVIVVLIEYSNVVLKPNAISYKYLPQVIDGNEYKNLENILNQDGSYTIVERHGIRFVFQQHGVIGQFDFISLLTNIVASLALFKVSSVIVELLMLHFLPEKQVYENAKFEETDNFSDIRKNLKAENPDRNINA